MYNMAIVVCKYNQRSFYIGRVIDSFRIIIQFNFVYKKVYNRRV